MKQKLYNIKRQAAFAVKKGMALVLIALVVFVFHDRFASAAALSTLSDVMTRLNLSTASSHDISFTLDGSNTFAAGETITIDFHEDDSDFTVDGASSATADFDFNDGTERTIYNVGSSTDCSGSSGADDISVGIDDTTGIVTFLACPSFSASSSGASVNIEYGTAAGGTNRVTNPSSADTYVIDIGGTFGDSGKIAVAAVDDEQVVVSTTIDPYLTFTVSQNTVSLTQSGGSLNPDYSNTGFNNGSANTLAASTNATNGYTITYLGSTLSANGGSDTIDAMATKAASSTGTEQFGINLKDNATPNTGADASAASATTTFTVSYIVNVSQTTEAGAYSTTITYICTGNF